MQTELPGVAIETQSASVPEMAVMIGVGPSRDL